MRTIHIQPPERACHYAAAHFIALPLAAIIAACGTTPNSERQTNSAEIGSSFENPAIKAEVIDAIRLHYFQEPEIDTTFSAPDIVSRLDPFSNYLTQEASEKFERRMHDEEYRYGFQIEACGRTIVITSVEQGSPAEEAGLLPGDEIESVSKMLLYGSEERFDRLLRLSSKKCEFGIRRVNEKKPIRVWIERASYTQSSVPIALMLDSVTGFIEIDGFHEGTTDRLSRALDQLKLRGAKSMILDLRGNSGGFLKEAMRTTNLFIHSDSPVLEIHSRTPEENNSFTLPDRAPFAAVPLVLLVDGGSASATEVFAGILQDRSRATIIGQPTRGKGMVMKMFDVSNNDKLYLATSEYYLPSGRCVQLPYWHDTLCQGYSALETQENFDHKLDLQLATNDCRPYPNAEGSSLYGGEGIVPDIIVGERDYPCWLRGSIYSAITPYLHQNADWLLGTRLDKFDEQWTVPEGLAEVALADSRVKDTSDGKLLTAQVAWEVPQFVKWYIAYCVWGSKGTFAVRTRHTAIVKRALDVLQHRPPLLARSLSSVQ